MMPFPWPGPSNARGGEAEPAHRGPGKMTQQLRQSRTLGWDRNPLRRRTDRAEVAMMAALALIFLVAAPLLGLMVGGSIRTAGAERQQAEAGWRQVTATVQPRQPRSGGRPAGQGSPAGQGNSVPALARWTAPDGQPRRGWVPAPAGAPAGTSVRVWVSRSGSLTGPPLQTAQVQGQEAIAGVATVYVVGLLVCLAGVSGRYLLQRRRLAAWERAWRAVEPEWAQRR
jgi:hypothetical protein